MTIITFAPATRLGSHIIVTAYGVSGCGKTLSLLLLGRGLAGPTGKLGMIDTETGRGRIYASRVPGGYLYGEMTPPFTPERYIEAIDDAEKAGVEVLVLDSGSHEWEGFGGILEIADAGESRGGQPLEGLVKWAKPKARHKKFVNRLLNSHMHLLIGLRAKEKMRQYTAKDRLLPEGVKVGDIVSEGYAPIADKRFIFETTVQLFLPLGQRADLGKPVVEKCPEDLWAAFPESQQISEKTGATIREWVAGAGGEAVDKELLTLRRQAEEAAGGGVDAFRAYWRGLSKSDHSRLTDRLDNLRSIAESADADRPIPPTPNPFVENPFFKERAGQGQDEAATAFNLIDADGVSHSYDDPESAFEAMRTLLLTGRDARGDAGVEAAWDNNQPTLNDAFEDAGRTDLINEAFAYYHEMHYPPPETASLRPAVSASAQSDLLVSDFPRKLSTASQTGAALVKARGESP